MSSIDADAQLINSGGFSDVFATEHPGIVVKVFRRMDVVHQRIPDPRDHEVVLRAVCQAEVEGYEVLGAHNDLAQHAPSFHGTGTISDVLSNGRSVAHRYLLDCAYRMERLTGIERKISTLSAEGLSEIETLLTRFRKVGIGYLKDASCFIDPAGGTVKLFDFATWDAFRVLTERLVADNRLSDEDRRNWGLPDALA